MADTNILLPAAIGAGALAAYGKTKSLNLPSAAIAGAAVGLGVAVAARRLQGRGDNRTQDIALGVALLSLVAYDRWYDKMWPFEA